MNEASLNFYPLRLSTSYITESGLDVDDNQIIFLIIMIAAISITLLTAVLIIPIILRIESNKE